MLLEDIARIDGNTLLTYGLLGLTSVVLAVVTIYDKEDVDDDITPQEESVIPSFDSILPNASEPPSSNIMENTSMTPSVPEMEEVEEKVENMGGKCKSKKRKTIKKKSKAKK